ncbi:MAG TPA: ABC-2 transporter permease [Candidatus Saccharimonadia bacterium]
MKLSHVLAIARKQFLTLKHDHRTVALMLVAPVLAMLIFGFAFGTSPKHIPVVIVNHDAGATAGKIVDRLDHDRLSLTTSNDEAAARQRVRDGKAVAVVVFPAEFSANAAPTTTVTIVNRQPQVVVTPPKGAHAEVYTDTTSQSLAQAVMPELARATQKLAANQGAKAPIAFDGTYAFSKAKDARYIDYFVPGIMAFAITFFTTLLTLLAFVGERTSGTLNRLRVSPATEAEIVLGNELAFGIIAAVQASLILAVAVLVYHVLIVGALWLAVLLVVLTAIDAQAIGISISAAARREGQAVQFIPLIIFPVFLLSGIFVPVMSLPAWLQPFSYVLAPTWAVDGLRDVLLRGWGWEYVWVHVLVLAGFAVLFTGIAIVGLRRARS